MKLNQKKGEVTDVLIFVITIFILAIGFFVLMYVIPSITSGLNEAGLNNSQEGRDGIESINTLGTSGINYGFLLLFVGLIMSIFITSFLVRTHPIFLFLYIFFLAITLLISIYLGNVFYDLHTNPIFANIVSNATFLVAVMDHIVEIALAVGAISMIIVFSKFSSFGGGQQY